MDNDHDTGERKPARPEPSPTELYDLLKLRAVESVEQEVVARLKRWGALFAIAGTVAGVLGVSSIWSYISGRIDSTVQSEVQQRVEQRLGKLEDRIDVSWESGIKAKVTSDQASESMSKLGQDVRDTKESVTKVEQQAGQVHGSLAELRKELDHQAQDIRKTQAILAGLYKNLRNEIFQIEDGPRVRIQRLPKGAIVVMRLEGVPVAESVRVQWHIYSQPPNSYWLRQNILIFHWGDDAEQLRTKPIYVGYSLNPDGGEILGDLSERQDQIYAGDTMVLHLVGDEKALQGEKPPK